MLEIKHSFYLFKTFNFIFKLVWFIMHSIDIKYLY